MWPSHPHVGECLLNNALGMEVRLSCWRLVCCGEHSHLPEQRPWGSGGAGYLDVLRCPFPVLPDQASGVPRRHAHGQTPHTVGPFAHNDLVDKVQPGDRVHITGEGSTVRPLDLVGGR